MNTAHINLDEIHQFLRQPTADSRVSTHIEDCNACRATFTEEQQLFEKMQTELLVSPKNDLWQQIEDKRNQQQNQHQNLHQGQQQTRRNRMKDWSFGAIAASLLLVVGLQWNSLSNQHNIQNQIQAAIFQSQKLENERLNRSVNTPQNYQQAGYAAIDSTDLELQAIDEKLQQAYQQNNTPSIILDLWKQRIEVLNNKNKENSTSLTIETI